MAADLPMVLKSKISSKSANASDEDNGRYRPLLMALRLADTESNVSGTGRPLTRRELEEIEPFFLSMPVFSLLDCVPFEAFDGEDAVGGDGEAYDTMFNVASEFEVVGCEVRTFDSEMRTCVLDPEADEDVLPEPTDIELTPL